MADSDRSRIIPDGWIFKPKVRRGSDASHYFCPATGQIFSTYKALMHYVEYAKKAKVSIYAPDFDADESSRKRKGRSHTKTEVCKPVTRGKVPSKGTKAASAALKQLPSDDGQITVPKSGISGKVPSKSWEEGDSKEVFPAVGQVKGPRQRREAGSAALKQLPSDVGQNKALKFRIGGEFPKEVSPAMGQTEVPRQGTQAGSAALKQLRSGVGQNKVLKFGIGGESPNEVSPAKGQSKGPCQRKEARPAALQQHPSDVGQNKVLKFRIGGELPKEESPAVGQSKGPHQRKEASPTALKQRPSDVDQNKVLKFEIGGESPKEVSPAVGQSKGPRQRKEASPAALKQRPSDFGQNKVLKFGIGGEFPKEVSPAVGQSKGPRHRKEASPAALKQRRSDVGQNKVLKSEIGGKFPKEVSPAVGQTKIPCQRTQAGSAALKLLPSDVGQNKVLKFGIGGAFPPKGSKDACPADVEQVFSAVHQTKVTHKRTEAGSAAVKQLTSAVGQSKVPKFGISENIPCKRWKEACPLDAEEISPGVNHAKVPMVATREKLPLERREESCHAKVPMVGARAELSPQRREESCLPDLKELSPGDDHSRDLKSALGVEYPPKKLREGYVHISPAVDQTSIWSTPKREKIPPRRNKNCPPAIEQHSFGQSSKLGGTIDESEANIGPMGVTPMGDFGVVQQYTPLEGGSSETNYDWAFEGNIFPFETGFESGEEPTISAIDRGFQYYMESSRPCIEHQYRRRNERNKSTRPTVGQLRKKGT